MFKRVIADCIVRYEVVEPKNGLYGGKTPDGNVTGLIGMLIREVRFNPKYKSQFQGFIAPDSLVTIIRSINIFITFRKRSCGKVMFLHLSVILFTGGGVYPPRQTPPG